MTLSLFYWKISKSFISFFFCLSFSSRRWIQRPTHSKKGGFGLAANGSSPQLCAHWTKRKVHRLHPHLHYHLHHHLRHHLHCRCNANNSNVTTCTTRKPWPASQWLEKISRCLQTEWWCDKSSSHVKGCVWTHHPELTCVLWPIWQVHVAFLLILCIAPNGNDESISLSKLPKSPIPCPLLLLQCLSWKQTDTV